MAKNTLLFGNGINRTENSPSWDDILGDIVLIAYPNVEDLDDEGGSAFEKCKDFCIYCLSYTQNDQTRKEQDGYSTGIPTGVQKNFLGWQCL